MTVHLDVLLAGEHPRQPMQAAGGAPLSDQHQGALPFLSTAARNLRLALHTFSICSAVLIVCQDFEKTLRFPCMTFADVGTVCQKPSVCMHCACFLQAKTHEKVDSIGEERSIGCHAVIMLIRKDMA
jgi:2C-methyl-D-erythritol 2,4-cyclodiphosphate synthase